MSQLTAPQAVELQEISHELAYLRDELEKMQRFAEDGGHIDRDHLQGRCDDLGTTVERLIQFRLTHKPVTTMKGQHPMQATRSLTVTAKRIPATDRSGSKIVAKSSDGKQITIPYPHQSNEPHEMAVRRLYPNAVTVTEVATSTERAGLKFFVEVPA
jgi:hypothetical protein